MPHHFIVFFTKLLKYLYSAQNSPSGSNVYHYISLHQLEFSQFWRVLTPNFYQKMMQFKKPLRKLVHIFFRIDSLLHPPRHCQLRVDLKSKSLLVFTQEIPFRRTVQFFINSVNAYWLVNLLYESLKLRYVYNKFYENMQS